MDGIIALKGVITGRLEGRGVELGGVYCIVYMHTVLGSEAAW